MIKILNFGIHSPNSSLNIIQRNGKKIVLALAITIETTADKISEIDPTTPVSFGLEEVPLKAVQKLISESDGVGAIVAIEFGKPLSGDALEASREYVRRYVGTVSVSDLK